MTSRLALQASLAFDVDDFRVRADLSLAKGVLVLFGPSGAGKTLTLRALAGLVPRVTGHVHVGGRTLLDSAAHVSVPAHLRRVGYVPQAPGLFPFVDVATNVAFGLPSAERRQSARSALLAELEIGHLATRRPDSLSGGEAQRVALARALAAGPRLLLLDEPFAALDGAARRTLRAVVRAVVRRHDVPAIFVTHDVEDALDLGDEVARFDRGETVEQGRPRDVLGPRAHS